MVCHCHAACHCCLSINGLTCFWDRRVNASDNTLPFPAGPVVRYPKSKWIPVLLNAYVTSLDGATDGGSFFYRTTPEEDVAGRGKNYYQPAAFTTTFLQTGLTSQALILDNIRATRAAMDVFEPHMYPYGFLYDSYEQYLNPTNSLKQSLTYSICKCAPPLFVHTCSDLNDVI
jgi:hypothetical protein